MADGKIIIDTSLDSSGLEKGLSKLGGLAKTGAKAAVAAVGGVATALGGVAVAAGKVGMDFEAQMSRVQAISGATGDELKKLQDQAVELGAKTAFSALESAEGMENLASAGFNTQEILAAMPGMLDLAASSGEDLASSADIAASTLRGFGMEASQAGHVADVLAKNAADTNAAVADTGEAMKYVAPLANSMGLEFEECAAAIGIMADNGIKGSQAGTTLRGALSRLSKPTKVMREAMEDLGISFYDSEGKMKSLNEQIAMVKQATAGMTDEQRNNYLVTLYGQEALSGMLALMNTQDGKLAQMTESYKSCDGAADEMAATMQDNLASAIEQVGGAAESFGITVYESIKDPLKDAANSAADAIDQMTQAFKENGAQGAAEAAGGIIANLVTGIAEKAPDVIDMAVKVIQAFVKGLKNNKDRLIEAAGEIVKALVDGLVSLLPKEIGDPIKKTFDGIGKSLKSGGLKKGIDAAVRMFKNLVKAIGQIIDRVGPVLVKILDFIGENLETIGPIAAGVVTAFVTFNKVGPIINGVTTAIKGLSAGISMTPIGIISTAIAAFAGLAIAVATSESAYDKAFDAAAKLSEEQEALVSSIDETNEAYARRKEAAQEAYASIETEYQQTEALVDELQEIVDQNGNIKQGYEDRAIEIVEALETELGITIDVVDGQIQKYGELTDAIEQVIQKKKAEAMASALNDSYVQAQQENVEVVNEYVGALKEAEEQEKVVAEARQAYIDAQNEYNDVTNNPDNYPTNYIYEATAAWNNAEASLKGAEEKQRTLNSALEDAEWALAQNRATLENYDAIQSAIASGSSEELNQAVQRSAQNFITAESGTRESLERQTKNFKQQYEDMKTAQESGLTSITDEQLSSMQQMVADSEIELQKLATSYDDLSQEAINGFLENINGGAIEAGDAASQITPAMVAAIANSDMKSELSGTAKEGLQGLLDAFSGMDEETRTAMAEAITPMLEELEQADPELYAAAAGTSGSVLNSIIETFGVGAPTIYTATKTGVTDQVDQAVRDGRIQNDATATASAQETINATATAFTNGAPAVATAATNMANAAGQGLYDSESLVNAMVWASKMAGVPVEELMNHLDDMWNVANQLAQAGATGFTAADLEGIFGGGAQAAANAANEYLAQGAGTAEANAAAYGTAVTSGIQGADIAGTVQTTMSVAMTGMNTAFTTGSGTATKTVQNMVNQLRRIFQASNLQSIAKMEATKAGAGIASGIRSQQGAAVGAASGIINSAIKAIEDADAASKAFQVGVNFGNGLKSGIASKTGEIAKQAADTVRQAIDAANHEQNSNSPAKELIKSGHNFGEGYEIGIEDMGPAVERASAKMVTGALDAAARKTALARARVAMDGIMQRTAVSMSLNHQQAPVPAQTSAEPGEVTQTVNIYQPVKSPVEMSREIKRTAKEMTWH